MRVPIILFSLLVSFSSAFSFNQGIDFIEVTSEEDWKNALEQAATKDQLLFIDAYTDWCTWCHKLDKEVYTNSEVIDYYNGQFINVKFDAETPFGSQLAGRFGVDSYPTLLFLTKDQEVFEAINGFVPAPTLLAYGEQADKSYRVLPILEAKYEDLTITRDEELEMIGLLERSNPEKARIVAKKYFGETNNEDYKNIETLWLASRFENQLSSAPYRFITSHKADIVEWHGEEEYKDYIKAVYNDNLNLSIRYGDEALLNDLVTQVLKEFLEDYDIAEAAFITKKLYYGQRQEYDKYGFEVNTFLNNQVAQSDREEFLVANALEMLDGFESETMYRLALNLLVQVIDINEKNFEATSLMGYTNALLGNFSSASQQLNQAKALAADDEQREMVDSLIEAMEVLKGN